MRARPTLRLLHLTTAALALTTSPMLAQDSDEIYLLDEIVVSGSLIPVAKSETGATVETLDADETGAAAQSVSDVLATLPGVSMSRSGGVGATTTLRIRGLSSEYIGVRLNGIDITDTSSTTTQYDFGGLLSYGVSSIEVLKGSQSALYGSEAVAGVVSMDTLSGEPGLSTTVEAGSYGTYSAGISDKIESEKGSVAFTLSHYKTDGFSASSDNDEDDGFEETVLTFGLEQDVSDTVTLGLTGFYRTSDLDYDGYDDVYATSEREEKGLRAFAQIHGDVVTHEISASLFNVDRTNVADTYVWGVGMFEKDETDYTSRRKELTYLGSATLSSITTLTFGAEYIEEKYSSVSGAYGASDGKNHNTAVKAEWLHSPTADLNLSAALRYDDHSDFGDHISGRLAASWDVAPEWTARAVLGTGFRAPSLYELFGPYGNADLKEETSQSAELGLERRLSGDDFIKATLFYTEIEDRIDYDFSTSTYSQVAGTTTSKGIELSGHYTLSETFSLFGSYTYTDAKTAGERAVRVPRHDLVVGIDALLTDRLSGQVTLQHVADIIPSEYAPADHKVDDYTLFNASLSYDLTDTVQLYLRADNLTDEDYETVGGYNTPGRSAYLGLKASF
ncbi:TonB-dependent receptor plug domain-containing protein [Celeribacter halophilus]|uniref:TonB-dependent receptor plug domain-containing protein n=1 Tax=Celeribacter halophilus TaxID=576117 RepID=UPI002FD59FC0